MSGFDYSMLGGRVLCAVSGGADSVYLLHRCLEGAAENGFGVCAAHYNHCLRGAESDRDERFVQELCAQWDVPCVVGRGDVGGYARQHRLGTEEAARKLRYDFLENTEAFREEEGIPTALLLHIPVEDEDEEQEMVSLFDGVVQSEFTKFFHTVIAVMNPETALEETFEDVFESLMDEMAENGYLDKVINNIANYMSDPEVMEAMLFPDEDEDDEE